MAFSGQLYQFESKSRVAQGAYVAVNGPFDSFGVVLKSELRADGSYMNLIRGVAKRTCEKPVASF